MTTEHTVEIAGITLELKSTPAKADPERVLRRSFKSHLGDGFILSGGAITVFQDPAGRGAFGWRAAAASNSDGLQAPEATYAAIAKLLGDGSTGTIHIIEFTTARPSCRDEYPDLDAALVYAEAMVRRDPDCIVLSVAHLSPNDDDEQLVATPFGTAMWGGAGFRPLHGDDLVLEYVPAIEAARELVATAMAA